MKILLLEDDWELSTHLAQALKRAGMATDTASTAEDGLIRAETESYDCLIFDVSLPDGNGFDLCHQLRNKNILTPILFLTARGSIEDRLRGLDLGGDDYLAKPADSREVVARVRSLIRRSHQKPTPTLQIGRLKLNQKTQEVKLGQKSLALTSKEFSVLEFLAFHKDQVVTRTMLMEHVWGSDFESFSNVIDVYIRTLRKKISQIDKASYIKTIRGSGYRLSEPA